MKATTHTAADRSSDFTRLGTINMGALERRHANASLRDAELITALVLRAAVDMRAIARRAERAASGLASGIKTMFAKPVKH